MGECPCWPGHPEERLEREGAQARASLAHLCPLCRNWAYWAGMWVEDKDLGSCGRAEG